MKITVDVHYFRGAFMRIRPDNFSYRGLEVLFDFLEECEDPENESELDVIAICCDFSESTIREALDDYDLETIEELQDNTNVMFVDEDENDEDSLIIYCNY